MSSAASAAAATPAGSEGMYPGGVDVVPSSAAYIAATAAAIEADLRSLCVEARRKYPELQSSAERALVKLRALSTPDSSAGGGGGLSQKSALELLQGESVVRPLLLACGTKVPKLTLLALGSLQRLVTLSPLTPRFVSTLLGSLRIHAESDDQQVQLRILQTLLQCITPAAVSCGELLQSSLAQALGIALRLFLHKKSSIVHHTAFAAVRQVVTLLFDRVAWQSQNGCLWTAGAQPQPQTPGSATAASAVTPTGQAAASQPDAPSADSSVPSSPPSSSSISSLLPPGLDQLSPEAQNAFLLFTDLCIVAGSSSSPGESASGARPRWLSAASGLAPEVCIELLENAVSSCASLFAQQPVLFAHLVRRELCGLLLRLLRTNFEFGMVLRLIRCALALLRHFHTSLRDEGELLLSLLLRMLSDQFPLWHRVLVLEALMQILKMRGDKMAYWIYATYDHEPGGGVTPSGNGSSGSSTQTKVYTSLIHTLSRVVTQSAASLGEGASPVGGGLGVTSGSGSGGSAPTLLTHGSPTPVVPITTPSPSSPSPSSGGSAVTLQAPPPLPWKTYSARSSRGLELLGLEGSDGSSLGSSAAAGLYEESYVITLAAECIVTVVNGLAALAKTNDGASNGNASVTAAANGSSTAAASPDSSATPSSSSSDASDSVDVAILRGLVDATCLPALGALSLLLHRTSDESQVQYLLLSYQSFTNTAGVLGLTRARDAFLLNLCAFALPPSWALPRDEPPGEMIKQLFGSGVGGAAGGASGSGSLSSLLSSAEGRASFAASLQSLLLSPKNIQSLKALFNISHCLSEYLGSASWLRVLETFQSLDALIQLSVDLSSRLSRESSLHDLYSSLAPHQTEVGIMAAALSRLFESTRFLDDQSVTHVLSALGTLSLSSLANAATGEGGSSGGIGVGRDASMHTATLPNNLSTLNLARDAPTSIRMFALTNLIATLEHNLFRITSARLWELGVGHLTCVVNHRDASVRRFGVAALTKITILALTRPTTYTLPPPPPTATVGTGEANVATRKSSSSSSVHPLAHLPPGELQSAIQVQLLEPFADLFRSRHEDTRENILHSLFQILQSAGQCLAAGGWRVVLRVLQAVVLRPGEEQAMEEDAVASGDASSASESRSSDSTSSSPPVPSGPSNSVTPPPAAPVAPFSPSFIPVGFHSVQLIANDYLESIPYASLPALVRTIAAYCAQTHDTNISFTSIGLLWRVSDYVAKIVAGRARTGAPSSSPGQGSPDADNDAASAAAPSTTATQGSIVPSGSAASTSPPSTESEMLDESQADALMQLVFSSLVRLSTDRRTEVRNSAVKTLHATLAAHAPRSSQATHLRLLSTLVLPLLSRLLTDASLERSSSSGSGGTELGVDKATGKAVMMLIHYSRDSASKQWDETRVFALQGTARVLKAYTESMLRGESRTGSVEQQMQEAWSRFLSLNLVALASRSGEVALSALNAVLDLAALVSSSSGVLARGLRRSTLRSFYASGVRHALVQHQHLLWLEAQERAAAAAAPASKGNKLAAPVIDTTRSPYATQLGDQGSDDGWKNWVKTYTHLVGHLCVLAPPLCRATVQPSGEASEASEKDASEEGSEETSDLVLLLRLSHALLAAHSSYTDSKAAATLAARRATAGADQSPPPDRKEHPLQAAHLKLIDALVLTPTTATHTPAGSTTQPPPAGSTAASVAPLPSRMWSTLFEQLLGYLLGDYAAQSIEQLDAQIQAALDGRDEIASQASVDAASNEEAAPAPMPAAVTNVPPPPSYHSGPASPTPSSAPQSTAFPPTSSAPAASTPTAASTPSQQLVFPSSAFAKKVLRALDRAYSCAPARVRAAHFSRLLLALQRAISSACSGLSSRTPAQSELAEEAVAAFIHVLEAGLASVGQASDGSQVDRSRELVDVWNTIERIFASFLSLDDASAQTHPDSESSLHPLILPARPGDQQRLWENLQIALVGCLLRIVLPQLERAPDAPQRGARFMRFFNLGFDDSAAGAMESLPTAPSGEAEGASIAPVPNELLSHSCLMALFSLVRSRGDLVARLAAPLLLRRCEGILLSFLRRESLRPLGSPAPRCRREEVGFVLRELSALHLHPSVADTIRPMNIASDKPPQAAAIANRGERAHLLVLFPTLCKCITMRDVDLRDLLRDVFELAAVEIGLMQASALTHPPPINAPLPPQTNQ